MPSRTASRKQPIVVEEPLGSEQSAASFARDKAAQPALLAAAARRKDKKSKPTVATPIKKKERKVINLKSLVSPTSAGTSRSSTSSSHKTSPAMFSLIKATYQKGDKKGQPTGAVYFRGKPRYGANDLFKSKVNDKLLEERLRWNDELKLYTAKVYTAKQSDTILDEMRKVSAAMEKDLNDVIVDESVFEGANLAEIKMFPIEVEKDGSVEVSLAIGGMTYPFKTILKNAGFQYNNTVNGEAGVCLWLRPESEGQPEVDEEDLEAIFTEYGFTVDTYDGVDSDDEDSD